MPWVYAGFIALVLLLLALDLGVFHRESHVISVREALGWSAFWIALGVAFVGFIYRLSSGPAIAGGHVNAVILYQRLA